MSIPGPSLSRAAILARYERNRLETLLAWADEFGDIVDLGDRNYLVNEIGAIRMILRDTGKSFVADQNFLREKVNGQKGSFEMERWMAARHAVIRSQTEVSIAEAMPRVVAGFETLARDWALEGVPQNPLGAVQEVTSAAVAALTVGENDEVARLSTEVLAALGPVVASPFQLPSWARFLPRFKKIDKLLAQLDATLQRAVPAAETPFMTGLRDAGLPLKWQIEVTLSTLLAGNAVPAAAIVWGLLEAARNDEYQELFLGDDRQLQDVYVREVLRLWPPSWMLGRRVTADTEISGHIIGRGSTLYISNFVLHRSSRYWRNPHVFDPKRWIDPQNTTAYLPYGYGPRFCIGSQFANEEIRTALTAMVTTCRFRQIGSQGHRGIDASRTLFPQAVSLGAALR